jgi:hypothetical protein
MKPLAWMTAGLLKGACLQAPAGVWDAGSITGTAESEFSPRCPSILPPFLPLMPTGPCRLHHSITS